MDILKAQIIKKLVTRRVWGKKHTLEERLMNSIPSHYRGEAKKAVKELVREGFLIVKKTKHGIAYSLNIHKQREIFELIEKIQ